MVRAGVMRRRALNLMQTDAYLAIEWQIKRQWVAFYIDVDTWKKTKTERDRERNKSEATGTVQSIWALKECLKLWMKWQRPHRKRKPMMYTMHEQRESEKNTASSIFLSFFGFFWLFQSDQKETQWMIKDRLWLKASDSFHSLPHMRIRFFFQNNKKYKCHWKKIP